MLRGTFRVSRDASDEAALPEPWIDSVAGRSFDLARTSPGEYLAFAPLSQPHELAALVVDAVGRVTLRPEWLAFLEAGALVWVGGIDGFTLWNEERRGRAADEPEEDLLAELEKIGG